MATHTTKSRPSTYLEIAVDDASGMEESETPRNAPESRSGLRFRISPLVNKPLKELSAVHELQNKGDFLRAHIRAVVGDDARMRPHRLHDGELTLDRGDLDSAAIHDLQGHLLRALPAVPCAENLSKRAVPQARLDVVVFCGSIRRALRRETGKKMQKAGAFIIWAYA
jgi:hypothetical protein